MNHNKRVMRFALMAVALMLLLSFYAEQDSFGSRFFRNVSIFSDIVTRKSSGPPLHPAASPVMPTVAAGAPDPFLQYLQPRTLVRFSPDTATPSLPVTMQRLAGLKAGEHRKVRIAWLGDSMIEGDLLTQTFRRRLQEAFGGNGAGFVAVQSPAAAYRTTVKQTWSGDWTEENLKSARLTAPLFLSGHVFFPQAGTFGVEDATSTGGITGTLVKSLICGPAAAPVSVTINGRPAMVDAPYPLNRIVLDSSNAPGISVQLNNSKLPVYGVSLEGEAGVVVDNLSFRGVSGIELERLDTALLQSMDQQNHYDLIVLQYGANLMFRPDNTDQSWYHQKMQPVLAKLRKALPNTEFLLISTADRAFRYDGEWKTATGIDTLLRTQAQLAYDNKAAFYNLYESMGGRGTIARWADSTVTLANKDYIHPNLRGAEILGNLLFDAFMKDYQKATKAAPAKRSS